MVSSEVSAAVGTRARIVLWHAEGRMKKDIATLAGVSRPTVDLWLARYSADGAAGLLAAKPGGPREQVSADVRSRVLALTRVTPPAQTGLSHWSTRTMADYVTRTTGTSVSHHWVANLWREHGLKPQKQGTFKLSKDPAFADKVNFHFTPTGSSWLNQIETWFGIITRQAIRRGTFASVQVLIRTIRAYITSWNTDPRPFRWTATADEILAKVRLTQLNIKKLVANNTK